MASKRSIAIKREAALERLEAASMTLSERFGIPTPDMRYKGRDAKLLEANNLTMLADWLERLEESTMEFAVLESSENPIESGDLPAHLSSFTGEPPKRKRKRKKADHAPTDG